MHIYIYTYIWTHHGPILLCPLGQPAEHQCSGRSGRNGDAPHPASSPRAAVLRWRCSPSKSRLNFRSKVRGFSRRRNTEPKNPKRGVTCNFSNVRINRDDCVKLVKLVRSKTVSAFSFSEIFPHAKQKDPKEKCKRFHPEICLCSIVFVSSTNQTFTVTPCNMPSRSHRPCKPRYC